MKKACESVAGLPRASPEPIPPTTKRGGFAFGKLTLPARLEAAPSASGWASSCLA